MNEQDALEHIILKDGYTLTPTDVAPLLGTTPQTIRQTARDNPQLVGFPFTYCGKQMKIPKQPFLDFLGIGAKR